MAVRRPFAASRRPSLSSERGSLLVEVMVGAIVLALATFAVLDGLEGAGKTGLKNKQRSVSATLAQQDIERLRSFPITALSNYRETRSVDVAGVSYRVVSRSDWVNDSSGLISCTNESAPAQYMKLTSTVNAPANEDEPVKEASLLTPAPGAFGADRGTVAIKLTNREGDPISGASVSLDGTSSFSDTTNVEGCALFVMIPAEDYEIDVHGLVGWGGEGFPAGEVTVVPSTTSVKQLEVDVPASIHAHLELPPGLPTGWATPALWNEATVANGKLPGGMRTFRPTPAGPYADIKAEGLFPFLDGYGVYAGACRANNPAFHQTDYFQPGGKGFVAPPPGKLLEDVQVQMGAMRVTVTNSSGNAVVGARVVVRQQDNTTGCNRDLLIANTTTTTGGRVDLALPFGTYRLCVSGTSNGQTRFRETTSSTHPKLAPPSSQMYKAVPLQLPSSGSSGNCSTVQDLSP